MNCDFALRPTSDVSYHPIEDVCEAFDLVALYSSAVLSIHDEGVHLTREACGWKVGSK